MFSRWDHVGGRNHFKIFRAKPDGTDMFVLYGAHSEGNSFLHPRDMDPQGKYKGCLVRPDAAVAHPRRRRPRVRSTRPTTPSRTRRPTPRRRQGGQSR
jgi:hypothetical protein